MGQPLIIKICGIRTADILEHAIGAGADMVGFVHFPKSPRHLELAEIAALAKTARGRVETAILLVDPDDAMVEAAIGTGVDWLQLHGHETAARVAEIRAATGAKILKALPVGGPEDVAAIPAFARIADRVLLDARPPENATRPGGLGAVFDWSLLESLDRSIPFMLSGGLDIDNVVRAIREVRPLSLDVSSGVERDRGVKDADLITIFIARARAAALNGDQTRP